MSTVQILENGNKLTFTKKEAIKSIFKVLKFKDSNDVTRDTADGTKTYFRVQEITPTGSRWGTCFLNKDWVKAQGINFTDGMRLDGHPLLDGFLRKSSEEGKQFESNWNYIPYISATESVDGYVTAVVATKTAIDTRKNKREEFLRELAAFKQRRADELKAKLDEAAKADAAAKDPVGA